MATINGDGSDNSLTGTNNDDIITGNAGNDRIDGQGGDDVIFGDDGDQSLPPGSLIYADPFDSGAAGWSPATTDNSEPFYGSVLGQFGGTAASGDVEVSRNFVFDPNFNNAVIEFDFHRLDSWDNHDFEIFSDGQQIFSQNFGVNTAVGQTQTTTINGTTYTVSFTSLGDAAENGYWDSGQFFTFDQSFAVRIEVTNAPADFDLGFGSTLDQSTFDESYAFDNFAVVSTDDVGLDIAAFTAANDTIVGGSGNDTIYGEEGDDQLSGDSGADDIFGGDGDDQIFGGTGDDIIDGGDGADTISAGDDADTILAGSGDIIDGGEGGDDNDTLVLGDLGATIVFDPGNSENGTVTFSDSTTATFTNIENIVPCFTPGSLISTERGLVPVENLQEGDLVETRDSGLRPIRWIGTTVVSADRLRHSPHLQPIVICKDSLAPNSPNRDMKVSPQHRMLIGTVATQLLLGEPEVLTKAKHLTHKQGISEIRADDGVTYIHIMFDHHEIVLVDNAWTESFQPGDMIVTPSADGIFDELLDLFPELASAKGRRAFSTARPCIKAYEALLIA